MACLSCAERAIRLKAATAAVRQGDSQKAVEELKLVGASVERDIRSGFTAAVQAARSRMIRPR